MTPDKSYYTVPVLSNALPPGGYTHALPWGQVFVDDTAATTAPNTRVEVGRIEFRIFNTATQAWQIWTWCQFDGALYEEDFSPNTGQGQGNTRIELTGNKSVKAGGGYTYHFFPGNRIPVPVGNIGGLITTMWARLVVDNPALPDDRASSRYMLSVGSDWWNALTGGTNQGAVLGRFVYVTNEWQAFHGTTMSLTDLNAHPPN